MTSLMRTAACSKAQSLDRSVCISRPSNAISSKCAAYLVRSSHNLRNRHSLQENKLEWTTVHRQFCEMIEANLEKRLEEVGLTPEQFVGVLEAAAKRSPENSTPRVVLEQLLAVEDFASFKRLMCKRRLEIEAETLRAIVAQAGDLIGKSDFHMAAANLGRSSRPVTSEDLAAALAALDLAALSGTGVASASPRGPSGAASAGGPPGETDVARAIRESLLEAEAARRLIDYERKMLEAAIAESLQISAADAARLVDMDGFWGSDVAAVVISATASSKSAAAASAAAPAAPAAALKPAVPAPAAAEPVAVAAAKAAAPEAAAAVVAPAAVALQPAAAARASEAACDPLAAVPAISAASPARNASATAAGVSASASVMEAAAVASPPRGVGAAASASVASPAGDAGSTGVSSSGGSSSMSGGSSMSGSSMSSLSALPPLGFASSPLNPLPRLPALSPTSARGAKGTLDALQLSAGLFADGGAGSSDDASRVSHKAASQQITA